MLNLKITSLSFVTGVIWLCSAALALGQQVQGQSYTSLTDLSSFKNPGKTWHIAGDVTADLNNPNTLNTSKGTGILVNLPDKKIHGKDLYTNFEHGDADLELDYMMAKGSNSGIYLQGRYELQLEDTWGAKTPTSANNGGIYESWDDSKPAGSKGYRGYAPRQNASRAPGLWQHLKISFQAPRFNNMGQKVENAKMLHVELNGVVIHDNV
ncbi:MAG: 3-keto-disaccharide hydrolase, partial [Daejeonella sp.]